MEDPESTRGRIRIRHGDDTYKGVGRQRSRQKARRMIQPSTTICYPGGVAGPWAKALYRRTFSCLKDSLSTASVVARRSPLWLVDRLCGLLVASIVKQYGRRPMEGAGHSYMEGIVDYVVDCADGCIVDHSLNLFL